MWVREGLLWLLVTVVVGSLAAELSKDAIERARIEVGIKFKRALEDLKNAKLESVNPKFENIVHLRQKRAVGDACPAGYTGENCENPICTRRSTILSHDGQADRGETMDAELSSECDQTFTLNVDEYMSTVYVMVYGLVNSNPYGILYDPKQNEIRPSATETRTTVSVVYTFKDLAAEHGLGSYQFVLSSYLRSACFFSVLGPSNLYADGGFVTSEQDDNVQAYIPDTHQGITRNPKMGVQSYFAFALPSTLNYPARPIYVGIYAVGVYETDMTIRARFKCNAVAIAGPYTCKSVNSYHVKIVGVDSQGNTWQRVYDFNCETTATPTPGGSQAPPTDCFNGGIMVNSSGVQECYCGQYFEGNECETKRCFNDGQLQLDGRCMCDAGFTNTYCQDVICASRSGQNFDISRKALTFVVRATTSMVANLQQVLSAATRITGFYNDATRRGYFQRFILVTVANRALRNIQSFTDSSQFISAIENIGLEQDVACEDTLLLGLSAALNTPDLAQYTYSPIFVFSDGLYDDDEVEVETLLHQLTYWRGQVFFMLTDSSVGRSCVVDIANSAYINLRYLAQFSHGLVAHVPVADLGDAAFNIAATVFSVDYLLSNDLIHSCGRAPEYQTFFVDSRIGYFFITATGTNLSCSITLPDRSVIVPELFYQSANVYIWTVASNIQYGGHQLTIKGNARYPCQYRVQGFTNRFLFLGVSESMTRDATIGQPVYMTETHIVGRLSSVSVETSQNLHTEAMVWTNEGESDTRVALYMSSGYYRDQCDYFLYFGSWVCKTPGLFYYINVFFVDEKGLTIMRSSTGFCASSTVTQAPPEGCMNGGVPGASTTSACLCPAHWNGTRCEQLMCLNLGTPVGSTCDCIAGYGGQFCEQVTCTQKNSAVNWSPNGRSLTFLIHDSITTRSSIRTLKDNMARMLDNSIAQHPEWITYYELIRFNNNESSIEVLSSSSTRSDFVSGINTLYERNTHVSEISCKDLPVLRTLYTALNNPNVTFQGIVFLFINGYMKIDFGLISDVYELIETTRVMVNVVLLSGSPCGVSIEGAASKMLMNLAEFSGGEFILGMPSNAGKIVHFLPTLYFSSYVYENYVENCSVSQQTFYFPVDSQTQSFTVYIVGDLLNPPVYYSPIADETEEIKGQWKEETMKNVWSDIGMGSRMDQMIHGCDSGWSEVENRCIKLGYVPATWYDARDSCHSDGAVMATIYDAYEQDFLDYNAGDADYWTGLNDIAYIDRWVWDQISDELTLDSTGYKNWASGQPTVMDVNNRCVYDAHKGSKGWTVANCALKKFYICMKHAYDSDFEPTMDGKSNILERGIWKMNVQTYEGACYVQIYSQSGIQMFTQFSNNVHDDSGRQQPLSSASTNRILAHMTNQNWAGQGVEGKLQYAHLYGTGNQNITSIIQAQRFSRRSEEDCSYEYISNEFKCPVPTFVLMATGIDRYGYLYQRLEQIMCLTGPTTTDDCRNGGVYLNGECVCPPGYEGMFCETPICQNNGWLTISNTICQCVYGFRGQFCEQPMCTRVGQVEVPTAGNRTFVLVLDGVQSDPMTGIVNDLRTILGGVFTETAKYANWYTHYTGVVFRDVGANATSDTPPFSALIESDTTDDFITQMMAEAQKPYTSAPTASRATVHAIDKAMTSALVQPRSEVFVVTAGDAEDYLYETNAMDSIGRRRAFVNFLIVGTDIPGGANESDPSVQAYYDLAEASGGGYYQVNASSDGLQAFWTAFMSTLFDTFFVAKVTRRNCSNLVEYVQVGANASDFIIDTYIRIQPTVTVTNADGVAVTPTLLSTSGTNYLMRVDTSGVPGLWTIKMDQDMEDGGFCSVIVRGQSTEEVYVGFIHDVGVDGGLHATTTASYPLVGTNANAISAFTASGTLRFVQVFSVDERTLLWASPLIKRFRCQWPYVSTELFTCPAASFALAVEGEDVQGHSFRRMYHIHCIGNFATVPPASLTTGSTTTTMSPASTTPLPTCDPDVPKFDVVLVFDASDEMSLDEFQKTIDVMIHMPEHVTIGPNNTRFIVGTYADTVDFDSGTTFDAIPDAQSFDNALRFYRGLGYKGTLGNNIIEIFNTVNVGDFRVGDDVQRLLIFFSTTGWEGFEDPTMRAVAYKRAGVSVMPIGYGPVVNMDQLNALSKCAKNARNNQELEALLPWIMSIFCMPEQTC